MVLSYRMKVDAVCVAQKRAGYVLCSTHRNIKFYLPRLINNAYLYTQFLVMYGNIFEYTFSNVLVFKIQLAMLMNDKVEKAEQLAFEITLCEGMKKRIK